MLIFLKTRKSYDPRDKVYGILSLADNDFRARLEPDYALSVPEVYMRVVMTSAATSQSLDVLSCVTPLTLDIGLPSFVPTWDEEIKWGEAILYLLRWGTINS
jgi:hypothetical protein